jgi:DNA repair exonuclease SbcCD ATPase subunit
VACGSNAEHRPCCMPGLMSDLIEQLRKITEEHEAHEFEVNRLKRRVKELEARIKELEITIGLLKAVDERECSIDAFNVVATVLSYVEEE